MNVFFSPSVVLVAQNVTRFLAWADVAAHIPQTLSSLKELVDACAQQIFSNEEEPLEEEPERKRTVYTALSHFGESALSIGISTFRAISCESVASLDSASADSVVPIPSQLKPDFLPPSFDRRRGEAFEQMARNFLPRKS